MIISSSARLVRSLVLAAALAYAGAVQAQGLSYDMSTVATGTDRSGAPITRTMSSGHGQYEAGSSRIDFTQSSAPVGMMSTGTYMITSASKHTVTSVNPAKHEYTVIDIAELGKSLENVQATMGGLAKMEVSDVKVYLQDLGAGEPLEGYATWKYRVTQSFTMNISLMGRTITTPSLTTTDMWVAPQLDGMMDPRDRPPVPVTTGPMAELARQAYAAYGKMRKGLALKSVSTNEGGSGASKHTTTLTTTITNVKKTSISPAVFEVPAGFTKVDVASALSAAATRH